MFIYFWLHRVFAAGYRLSLGEVGGGSSPVAVCSLIVAASLVAEHKLQAQGLQYLQHMCSAVVAHVLSGCGLWVLELKLSPCGAQA